MVGRRHARVQVDATPVDPAHRQAERLAADHVGELRLTRVQDFRHPDPRVRDQVSEQRAVRLVSRHNIRSARAEVINREAATGRGSSISGIRAPKCTGAVDKRFKPRLSSELRAEFRSYFLQPNNPLIGRGQEKRLKSLDLRTGYSRE